MKKSLQRIKCELKEGMTTNAQQLTRLSSALSFAWADRNLTINGEETCPIECLRNTSEYINALDPERYAELKQSWRNDAPGEYSLVQWANKLRRG